MTTTDTDGASKPSADSRGPQVSPELRRKLFAQLKTIYAEVEEHYPEFVKEAQVALSDKKASPRFGFIIRRLWCEDAGELVENWRDGLRARYEGFERKFDWTAPVDAAADAVFLARTLSVWQRRYVNKLKMEHAAEIVYNLRNLS